MFLLCTGRQLRSRGRLQCTDGCGEERVFSGNTVGNCREHYVVTINSFRCFAQWALLTREVDRPDSATWGRMTAGSCCEGHS